MAIFKNALCLELRPDAMDYRTHRCKRHDGHAGFHQVKYSDGKMGLWMDGDKEAMIVPRDYKLREVGSKAKEKNA